MEKATIIGVDLAKHVFQVHGAGADGSVVFCKKISRAKLLPFLASQPRWTCPRFNGEALAHLAACFSN